MNQIKAFYIDPETNTAEPRTIEDSLDVFYSMLRCRTIDIVTRKIGIRGRAFNIICDDEGAFANDPKISAIDNLGRVMLVGALLIVGPADEHGNLTGLTSHDVARHPHRIAETPDRASTGDCRPVLMMAGIVAYQATFSPSRGATMHDGKIYA